MTPLAGDEDSWTASRLRAITSDKDTAAVVVGARLLGRFEMLNRDKAISGEARQALFFSKFPSLKDFDLNWRDDSSQSVPILMRGGTAEGGVFLRPRRNDLGRSVVGETVAQYGHPIFASSKGVNTWLMPTLNDADEPLSPIATWWAILYGLSMLTRYRPSAWTTMIDIDSSPDATAIESILEVAQHSCLNLVVWGLEQARKDWSYIDDEI